MDTVITPTTLRNKRVSAGISGHALCAKLDFGRSKLTVIERGYSLADPNELARIDRALDELITAKQEIQRAAAAAGWPLTGATV
jgi:inorganic triphosphatase YgiF